MVDGDELFTVDEVAERVKVNPETVRRWIKRGRLPAVKPAGGPYRIHSTDLDRLFGASPKGQAPSLPEASEEERRKAEAPSETGHIPVERNDSLLEEQGRIRRYLSLVPTYASREIELWTLAVERDNFSKKEFEKGAQNFLDFESAYVQSVGTDLLGALRNGDITLPEAEREALDGAKASLDEWNRALWSAYDALKAREGVSGEVVDITKFLGSRQEQPSSATTSTTRGNFETG